MIGLEPTLPRGNWNLNPENSVAMRHPRSQDIEIQESLLARVPGETRRGKDKGKYNKNGTASSGSSRGSRGNPKGASLPLGIPHG